VDEESAKNFVLSKAADGELEQGVDAIVEDGIRNIRIRSLEKARTRLISEIGRVSALGNSQETAEDMSVMELLRQKMQLDAELANLRVKSMSDTELDPAIAKLLEYAKEKKSISFDELSDFLPESDLNQKNRLYT